MPNNTSALLWRGISLSELGFFDDAIGSFEKCLDVDPGYLNCAHFLSYAYLEKGLQTRALEIYEPTLEQNFHSLSEAYVPYYVRHGQRNLAMVLADIKFERSAAPVVEWIRALAYWQQKGFPDFCRALGDDNFECDEWQQ